jgi:CheY-like chemotaxis protein
LDPSLPPAIGDVNQLELAILNLSINARDAMPGGGVLTIATAIASGEPNTVTIAVSDTGCGMPPEVAERAFDPFYTTKPVGKGTGLGLSQVYGIVKQSGGDVTLESEPGKGTTVTLRLPRADASAIPISQADDATLPAGRSEKLLIVDDDADVRQLLTPFLSDLGYEVREATGGEDALSILADGKPDMMIIDFAMGGLNGSETALAARQRYPGIPILFISGFADTEALRSAVETAPLIHKPFRPAELAAAVRSIRMHRLCRCDDSRLPWVSMRKAHRHRTGYPGRKPANPRLRPERQRHFRRLPARLDGASDSDQAEPVRKTLRARVSASDSTTSGPFLILAPPAAL